MLSRLLLALASLLLGAGAAPAQPSPVALTGDRGDLRLVLSDGQVLRGAELVGATLTLAGTPVRIAGARPDPQDPRREVWLYDLRLPDDSRLCSADPQGEHWAMLLPDAGLAAGFSLTCSSGANGKCIRFGYAPWRAAPGGGTLAPYHAACVNLVRAAYGGPERAWTRDGMRIDIYDRIGIQAPENDAGDSFEAGWTREGAVCVAHPRVPENGGLAEIAAAHPRLAGRTGAGCTEAAAAALGALVFNRSRGATPR